MKENIRAFYLLVNTELHSWVNGIMKRDIFVWLKNEDSLYHWRIYMCVWCVYACVCGAWLHTAYIYTHFLYLPQILLFTRDLKKSKYNSNVNFN